ncbi:MAG TPA: DUF6265 family protein [Chitinophagaceae bacterium]|nr:DUF6265 family protein [Chitinophagaceae bacterium]
MKSIRYLSFLMLAVVACNSSSTKTQLVFNKLVGTWQTVGGTGFEQWAKEEDGSFRYVSFKVTGSDTSRDEHARIYREQDKWIFDVLVNGQNDGKAIKFTSSSLSNNSVQFSNPAHDFPTDINYTVVNADSVHAFIVGPNDKGGKDTIPYNFVRVK